MLFLKDITKKLDSNNIWFQDNIGSIVFYTCNRFRKYKITKHPIACGYYLNYYFMFNDHYILEISRRLYIEDLNTCINEIIAEELKFKRMCLNGKA